MSLLEVLLAGLLFFGSTAASLLLWSRAVATMTADARRIDRLEILETELQAIEIRLRDPGLLGSPTLPCERIRERLMAAVEREPAPAGVSREILGPPSQQPLRVRLATADLERERSYEPAAFGACSPTTREADGAL